MSGSSSENETAAVSGLGAVGIRELLAAAEMYTAASTAYATFEVSVRRLPRRRSYLVAAGLQQAIDAIEQFRIGDEDFEYLWQCGLSACFPEETYHQLAGFQFTGSVDAVPEGTVVFAGEPLLRIQAPAAEAWLVAAAVISSVSYQTSVATKTARLVTAAAGRPVFDLGARWAMGEEASVRCTRAAFVGGATATSNLRAAALLGLPSLALLPLDCVLRGVPEAQLADRLRTVPSNVTLLLDGVAPVDDLSCLLQAGGRTDAVLVDVPDIVVTAQGVRQLLDSSGCAETRVYVAGGLEEQAVERLVREGCPADGFGVGSQLVTVSDEPCLLLEYDLVEWSDGDVVVPVPHVENGRRMPGGIREVYRKREVGMYSGDVVLPPEATPPGRAMPLLVRVMENGQRVTGFPSLAEMRALCQSQLQMLDATVTQVTDFVEYPVEQVLPEYADLPEVDEELEVGEDGPVAAAPRTHSVLDTIDDSADFTSVSSMVESVIRAHGGEIEEADTAADEAAAPIACGTEESVAAPPPAAAEAAPAAPAPAPPPAEQPPAEQPPAEQPAAEQPPAEQPAAEQPPAEQPPAAAPTPPAPDPVPEPAAPAAPPAKPAATSAKTPEPFAAPATSPPSQAELEENARRKSSIFDAAARLKQLQGGGIVQPLAEDSADEAAPAAPAAPAKSPPKRRDPLLAAASRLRAMQGGGAELPADSGAAPAQDADAAESAEPAAKDTSDSKDASADESTKERPTGPPEKATFEASPLTDAAARLRAMRGPTE